MAGLNPMQGSRMYPCSALHLGLRCEQEELAYNPFLRCREPALAAFTGKSDPVDVLGWTRKLKDQG